MTVVVESSDEVSNLTLSKNSYSVTVYTEEVKENITKILTLIKPPQSTANYSAGSKDVKIVDLLRVEERYTVTGYIDVSDKATMRSIITAGGIISMVWDSQTVDVNIDKFEVSKDKFTFKRDDTVDASGGISLRRITFTAVKGTNI